ncbi:MAG: iron ABC transporter permease [Planctomycetales bacterium]|nr:iron ABC transporter permease [Planctomycetales bacterium]
MASIDLRSVDSPRWRRTAGLFLAGIALLVAGVSASLLVGDLPISPHTAWEALFGHQPESTPHVIVREWRLPRAIADVLVGASLATAGAVMQCMTRNPLASPSIMGLNAGASFATVVAMVVWPALGRPGLMLTAIAGATLGAALVYGLGALSRGGLTPVRLALTGVATSAVLGAIGSGVMIYAELGQDVTLWYARGTENVQWMDVALFTPLFVVGMLVALGIGPALNVMSLGQATAVGLGQRTKRMQFIASAVVLMLAGGAVAVAGPVGFVGLMAPHMVRMLMGHDQRVAIPVSALGGALLLLAADIGARLATTPYRAAVPVGVVTSLLGVPFFLYLACRGAGVAQGGRR